MTSVSHRAKNVAQMSDLGPKCPECGNHARLDNGACVCCEARKVAEESGRSAADALLLAVGRRIEHAIDQSRYQG
jgi:hypothetical protein